MYTLSTPLRSSRTLSLVCRGNSVLDYKAMNVCVLRKKDKLTMDFV